MAMQFEISEQDSKKAKIPHEIFLTNLIFNHILLFVTIISASSLAHYVVIVPIFSILSLIAIFIGARRARTKASWYVSGHWQICVKRSRIFLTMIIILLVIIGIIWTLAEGNLRPQHWAIGGAAILPVMVTILVLIVMESEALHHAKIGMLPNWIKERFPEGSLEPLVEEAVD